MEFTAFDNQPIDKRTAGSRRFLHGHNDASWAIVLAATRIYRFSRDDIVIHQGEVERALYIVLSGGLEVVLYSEEGTPRRVSLIQAGSIFGEQSFLDGLPRSATVRAKSAGEARVLHWQSFLELSETHPTLGRDILIDIARTLSERLRQTNLRLP